MTKPDFSKKLPSQKNKAALTGQFAENKTKSIQPPSKAYLVALDAVSDMGKKK